MAIAVVMDFEGATLDQYDRLLEPMQLEREGSAPPGCIFHWVTATESGVRVTDVWQSREQYEAFGKDQIGPFTVEVGFPGPPATAYFDVHNYLTGDPQNLPD